MDSLSRHDIHLLYRLYLHNLLLFGMLRLPRSTSKSCTPILNLAKLDLILCGIHKKRYGSVFSCVLYNLSVLNFGISDILVCHDCKSQSYNLLLKSCKNVVSFKTCCASHIYPNPKRYNKSFTSHAQFFRPTLHCCINIK